MAGSHVVVARYDMLALDVLDSDCIFIGDTSSSTDCSADASPSPTASPTPTVDEPAVEPTDTPGRPRRRRSGAPVPNVTIPPWDGKERLNILLIGADQRPGEGTYNTDTLIVVSIDPVTKQVAMFSLPRDTVDVPIPPGPARQRLRVGLHRQDQQPLRRRPQPRRPVPGQRQDRAATTASRRSWATSTGSTSSTSSRSTSTASRRSSTRSAA